MIWKTPTLVPALPVRFLSSRRRPEIKSRFEKCTTTDREPGVSGCTELMWWNANRGAYVQYTYNICPITLLLLGVARLLHSRTRSNILRSEFPGEKMWSPTQQRYRYTLLLTVLFDDSTVKKKKTIKWCSLTFKNKYVLAHARYCRRWVHE